LAEKRIGATKPGGPFSLAFGLWITTLIASMPLFAVTGEYASAFAAGFVLACMLMLRKWSDEQTAFVIICVAVLGLASASVSERTIDAWTTTFGFEDTPSVFVVAFLAAHFARGLRPKAFPLALAWGGVALGVAAAVGAVALALVRPPMTEVIANSSPIVSVVTRELPPEDHALEFTHEGVTLRVFGRPDYGQAVIWETDASDERGGFYGISNASFHVAHGRLIVFAEDDGERRLIALRDWPQNSEAKLQRGGLGLWAPSPSALVIIALLCIGAAVALVRARQRVVRAASLDKAVAGVLHSADLVELSDGSQLRVYPAGMPPGAVGVILQQETSTETYRDDKGPTGRVICGELRAAKQRNACQAREATVIATVAGVTSAWLAIASTLL
jgi:hypothetical protein